jgi:hypothetical protein
MRQIALELVRDGVIKETTTVGVEEAKELLAKEMANRYRWRIAEPDRTGEIPNDEQRYAEDCKACGVGNPYDC